MSQTESLGRSVARGLAIWVPIFLVLNIPLFTWMGLGYNDENQWLIWLTVGLFAAVIIVGWLFIYVQFMSNMDIFKMTKEDWIKVLLFKS